MLFHWVMQNRGDTVVFLSKKWGVKFFLGGSNFSGKTWPAGHFLGGSNFSVTPVPGFLPIVGAPATSCQIMKVLTIRSISWIRSTAACTRTRSKGCGAMWKMIFERRKEFLGRTSTSIFRKSSGDDWWEITFSPSSCTGLTFTARCECMLWADSALVSFALTRLLKIYYNSVA